MANIKRNARVARMRMAPRGLGTPGERIDTHHHIYPPNYVKTKIEQLLSDARSLPREAYLNWTPQVALEDMDKNGVATAITSITSPGVWFGKVREARKHMREANEYGARLATDYPGRFGMFAALALPDIEGSLREIEYALDVLKLDGIGLVTNYDSKLLGDPAFAPIMEELNRRKAIVFVHPTAQACCTDINPFINPPMYEFPYDTTRTIVSLLLSGTMARRPNIKFIFCHGGGVLPMLAGRIAGNVNGPRPSIPVADRDKWFPKGFIHEIAKSYYDVVSVTERAAMDAVRSVVPIDHLLLGSDLPFRKMADTLGPLHGLGFKAGELKMIERDNALRLFPRYAATRRKAA
jgi:predicted TIM-barrel fold metal-dependent hydrolase